MVSYSFIVMDFHHLLLAGLTAHAERNPSVFQRFGLLMILEAGIPFHSIPAYRAALVQRMLPRNTLHLYKSV